jgi:hypothetical protein
MRPWIEDIFAAICCVCGFAGFALVLVGCMA